MESPHHPWGILSKGEIVRLGLVHLPGGIVKYHLENLHLHKMSSLSKAAQTGTVCQRKLEIALLLLHLRNSLKDG